MGGVGIVFFGGWIFGNGFSFYDFRRCFLKQRRRTSFKKKIIT